MPFDARSTADDVAAGLDLSGKTAVVTGAVRGIGLETARVLTAHGADVVIAARDRNKLDAAAESIRSSDPEATVGAMLLDLASLASVRDFANEFLAAHDSLDLLINNAGVMCTPFGRTVDGFETQFGTNHLGHFLLTNLLAPALIRSGDARVINLTSTGHSLGRVDFDDPNYEHRAYDGWDAYGQSKTANVLFTVTLDARLRDRGVRSFAVHPGGIHTDLGRHMTDETRAIMTARMRDAAARSAPTGRFEWKSIPQGAATSVWAATSPDLAGIGGRYCEDCGLASPASDALGSGYQPYAVDPEDGARLWDLSERLVGQHFD